MYDLILLAVHHDSKANGSENRIWSITLTDGSTVTGALTHLGESSWVVKAGNDYYFSSQHVVKMYAYNPNEPYTSL